MSDVHKTGVITTATFYESGANFLAILEEDGSYLLDESGAIIIDESTTDDMASDPDDALVLSGQAMRIADIYILAKEFIEY